MTTLQCRWECQRHFFYEIIQLSIEKRHPERGKCEGVVTPIVLQNALFFSIATPYLVDPSPKVIWVMIPFNILNALITAQLL